MSHIHTFRQAFVFALTLAALVFSSCERVHIAERQTSLTIGEQKQLSVMGAVDPQDLAWYSARPAIATVTQEGMVEGVAAGETYVRMVLSANEQLLDSVKIFVEAR